MRRIADDPSLRHDGKGVHLLRLAIRDDRARLFAERLNERLGGVAAIGRGCAGRQRPWPETARRNLDSGHGGRRHNAPRCAQMMSREGNPSTAQTRPCQRSSPPPKQTFGNRIKPNSNRNHPKSPVSSTALYGCRPKARRQPDSSDAPEEKCLW